jgi:hypothetical protein
VWFEADYLAWFVKKDPISAPLVASANGATLFPTGPVDFDTLQGVRATGGIRVNSCLSFELSAFAMERAGASQAISSSPGGGPALFRPLVDGATGTTILVPLSTPGALAGGATLNAHTELYGAEDNLVYSLCSKECFGLNFLVGARFIRLKENLDINSVQSSVVVPGTTTATLDSFDTTNRFYGGQVGLQLGYQWKLLYIGATSKIGLGVTDAHAGALGTSSTTAAGTVTPGLGFLAPNSPVSRNENRFAYVPEGLIQVGFQITPHLSAMLGYSYLYWSRVARPGEQVSNVTGAIVPATHILDTYYWAQGFTGGLAFRY